MLGLLLTYYSTERKVHQAGPPVLQIYVVQYEAFECHKDLDQVYKLRQIFLAPLSGHFPPFVGGHVGSIRNGARILSIQAHQ
jgi:hypothetical protein